MSGPSKKLKWTLLKEEEDQLKWISKKLRVHEVIKTTMDDGMGNSST